MQALRDHRKQRIAGHFADWTAGEQIELRDVLHRLNKVLERVAHSG